MTQHLPAPSPPLWLRPCWWRLGVKRQEENWLFHPPAWFPMTCFQKDGWMKNGEERENQGVPNRIIPIHKQTVYGLNLARSSNSKWSGTCSTYFREHHNKVWTRENIDNWLAANIWLHVPEVPAKGNDYNAKWDVFVILKVGREGERRCGRISFSQVVFCSRPLQNQQMKSQVVCKKDTESKLNVKHC